MKRTISILTLVSVAAMLTFASCKNSEKKPDQTEQQKKEAVQKEQSEQTEQKTVDVAYLANLYCALSDEYKAKVFRGTVVDENYSITKNVENNFIDIYANNQQNNSMQFYMWTDKDGTKILGVNFIEMSEKISKKFLNFFTYDSYRNMLQPCKRLNEVITTSVMELRNPTFNRTFTLRTPTSPQNENITLEYFDKEEKYHEVVFKWDGHTFVKQ